MLYVGGSWRSLYWLYFTWVRVCVFVFMNGSVKLFNPPNNLFIISII